MTIPTQAAITRCARRIAATAALLAMTMAACSSGDASTDTSGASFSVSSADSGAAITSDATLFGLSKIAIWGSGIDATHSSVVFDTAQNATRPLVPDPARPGQFWLPIVAEPTPGTLSISMPDGAPVTMPMTLVPFKTSGAPGQATQDFLQSSLSTMDAAIRALRFAGPRPDIMRALRSASDLAQQELTWVREAMKGSPVVMARRKDGAPVTMRGADLMALDQMALYVEAMRLNGGALPPTAQAPAWRKLIDFLVPNALAQTTDSAAFAGAARATGAGLALAANAAPGAAETGADAFRQGADPHVVSLNMAGFYAAHYGDGLATIQALPNLGFTRPADRIQVAVSELSVGLVNEILVPKLNDLADDAAVRLVSAFTSAVDREAVEKILMNEVVIFKSRIAGVVLCPAGSSPVAEPEGDFVECVAR